MNRQSEFFFFTVQIYQTCRIPDETKKILGPKINSPNEGSMLGLVNVCGWFIHRTIR